MPSIRSYCRLLRIISPTSLASVTSSSAPIPQLHASQPQQRVHRGPGSLRCVASVISIGTGPGAGGQQSAAVADKYAQWRGQWETFLQTLHAAGHFASDPNVEAEEVLSDFGAMKRAGELS
jgi:hypothetical protein